MKMRTIAAAVTIIALLGGGFACVKTENLKSKAEIIEETLSGDVSAAEGITVDFGGYIQNNLLGWKNSYTYGGEQSTELINPNKDYMYSDDTKIEEVSLYTSFEFRTSMELFADIDKKADPNSREQKNKSERRKVLKRSFTDNAQEFFDAFEKEMTNSDEKEKKLKIRMQDVLKYYIIGGDIKTDETMSMIDFWLMADRDSDDADANIERKIWSDIQDFFKIPIIENEYLYLDLSMGGSESGVQSMSESTWMSEEEAAQYTDFRIGKSSDSDTDKVTSSDSFGFYTISCVTNEAAYFTFNPHTDNGKVVDTSLIPGGYGIYRLPYDSETGVPKTSELEMVYSLDPNKTYNGIYASPDGKKIFLTYYNTETGDISLHNAESDQLSQSKFCLTAEIIDIETKTCDDSFVIAEGDTENMTWARDDGEYLLFTDEKSQIKVYRYEHETDGGSGKSGGHYELFLDIDEINPTHSTLNLTDAYSKILYEKDRIITVSHPYYDFDSDNLFLRLTSTLTVEVNVFEKKGRTYSGILYSNLQDYYDLESGERIGMILQDEERQGYTISSNQLPLMSCYTSLLDVKRTA